MGVTDIEGIDTSREQVVDVTEKVQVYENGKAFSCECGQDIGIVMDRQAVICATCGKMCVDMDYEQREPPQTDRGQTTLGDW
jgi:hypothetical protein